MIFNRFRCVNWALILGFSWTLLTQTLSEAKVKSIEIEGLQSDGVSFDPIRVKAVADLKTFSLTTVKDLPEGAIIQRIAFSKIQREPTDALSHFFEANSELLKSVKVVAFDNLDEENELMENLTDHLTSQKIRYDVTSGRLGFYLKLSKLDLSLVDSDSDEDERDWMGIDLRTFRLEGFTQ